ncbi:hypothetical protein CVT24_003330 [Panaeolus cyanescens]|uniref:VanZ-like domain-containing protein n=1 Tax=Panaeolus cyanescens TaxID=181874 RepID=A0A409Y6V1_9AGAR|nr:hypothetical protein CVT24_003330 [Panaeolus cyanescens]
MHHPSLSWKEMRKLPSKCLKSVMKSHAFHLPGYDLPLRLRPWFMVFTALIMLVLAFLGFTNFSHSLPLNDKLLHFMCFGTATGIFYFIIDVEESARRIWFWRHSPLITTLFFCCFCGGVLSEFVQAALPYKEFQWGDVFANLLGSTLGLYISYYLEKYYRHRREISRLYRPITDDPSDYEDEDELTSTQLLPTHVDDVSAFKPGNSKQQYRLTDVWDEHEDVFNIGDDSEDEGQVTPTKKDSLDPPRIVVSQS